MSTNPLAASLDPANFENPLSFVPERWIGKNERDSTAASQPFSLGPRGCIGRRYPSPFPRLEIMIDQRNSLAWMEMRTTLAKLHFKYNLEQLDTHMDWLEDSKMHTLWQKPALRVIVTQRDFHSSFHSF